MIHAIIDIGSNTIRMAIYLIEHDGIELIMKKKHMVGLASYVRDGIMQQAGIDRAVDTLNEYHAFLTSFRIEKVIAFTTAALRNARNGAAAVREIEARTGIAIRVISGDEEATYDFIGATHDVAADSGLLIDIGGGSTEIVYYDKREIIKKCSLPIGSLQFFSKYVTDILPSRQESIEMKAEAEATIGAASEFADVTHALICGIGGTFKGATAMYNVMFDEPAGNTDLRPKRLEDIIARFQRDGGVSQKNTIMLMRTVPDRMHTLIPGLIIADVLAARFGSETITYSDSGVREGFIYSEILGRKFAGTRKP